MPRQQNPRKQDPRDRNPGNNSPQNQNSRHRRILPKPGQSTILPPGSQEPTGRMPQARIDRAEPTVTGSVGGMPTTSHQPQCQHQQQPDQQQPLQQQPQQPRDQQPHIEQPEQEGSQEADFLCEYFYSCLDDGVNTFHAKELACLEVYVDHRNKDQRELVYRLADQILWRNPNCHLLMCNVVWWLITQDNNYELVRDILFQRLNNVDSACGDMMSLEEVDELMQCQVVLDGCLGRLEEQVKQEE